MLQIHCPYCGLRDQTEFAYGGEAHIVRPLDPDACSDQEWTDYVFNRQNPKGLHQERWLHGAGCSRWFNAVRDTLTYEFKAFYKVGDHPPKAVQLLLDQQASNRQT